MSRSNGAQVGSACSTPAETDNERNVMLSNTSTLTASIAVPAGVVGVVTYICSYTNYKANDRIVSMVSSSTFVF